jgi:hypothetical protein
MYCRGKDRHFTSLWKGEGRTSKSRARMNWECDFKLVNGLVTMKNRRRFVENSRVPSYQVIRPAYITY